MVWKALLHGVLQAYPRSECLEGTGASVGQQAQD